MFENKVALVTGASRGIGAQMAVVLAEQKCSTVILAARDAEKGNALAAEIRKTTGCDASFVTLDVRSPEECKAVVANIVEKYGKLDVLLHAAGVLSNYLIEEIPQSEVDRIIDTNLKGTLYMLQAAGTQMLKQGYGKICCVASKAGKNAMARLAHYSSSKFGVIGLVQAAAKEWGRKGIYVNAICPGEVATDMLFASYRGLAEINNATFEHQKKLGEEMSLLGRLQNPKDVAAFGVFLVSDANTDVIGQAINVDAGCEFH